MPQTLKVWIKSIISFNVTLYVSVSVSLPETATAQVVATAQAVAFGAQRMT